jgi:hypothetical protein
MKKAYFQLSLLLLMNNNIYTMKKSFKLDSIKKGLISLFTPKSSGSKTNPEENIRQYILQETNEEQRDILRICNLEEKEEKAKANYKVKKILGIKAKESSGTEKTKSEEFKKLKLLLTYNLHFLSSSLKKTILSLSLDKKILESKLNDAKTKLESKLNNAETDKYKENIKKLLIIYSSLKMTPNS